MFSTDQWQFWKETVLESWYLYCSTWSFVECISPLKYLLLYPVISSLIILWSRKGRVEGRNFLSSPRGLSKPSSEPTEYLCDLIWGHFPSWVALTLSSTKWRGQTRWPELPSSSKFHCLYFIFQIVPLSMVVFSNNYWEYKRVSSIKLRLVWLVITYYNLCWKPFQLDGTKSS